MRCLLRPLRREQEGREGVVRGGSKRVWSVQCRRGASVLVWVLRRRRFSGMEAEPLKMRGVRASAGVVLVTTCDAEDEE